MNGGIDITHVCNFQCIHCYVRDTNVADALHCQMTFEEYCSIIDQISDAGCLWLQITGGEPLLRQDFTELYLYAKKKGLLPILFTNGSLITEEIARLLGEYSPFIVEITLYGASAKTYGVVTGNADNFLKVKRGIELLKKNKVPFRLKTVVLQQNIDEFQEIKNLADTYGFRLGYDFTICQNLTRTLALETIRVSPEDAVGIELADDRRLEEWRRLFRDFTVPKAERNNLFWCNPGRSSFHIDAECNMSACIIMRTPSFSLRKGRFLDGWHNLINKTVQQVRTKKSKCTDCEIQVLCSQCPGHAQLEHNDREKPVDYFCQIAHLRKEKFFTS